ncbi:hypothetical protein BDY21DRAFT_315193 [Lineolata rhizophorae]|uniref:Short-chain dehydrogenase n=1 Tax=Lineolata rhizophorae TaxID=578093 RepID=A0A6A6PB18_9PEZI|nr:hypothetical protein BDY21DRAFT_315193 [Lineolata rhizophorae]
MPLTHTEYGVHTEAATAAAAFASQIKGKIILITGVNSKGIGGETALALAAYEPKLLIAAGRTSTKVEEALKPIKDQHPGTPCKIVTLDLSSQKSCREAAKEILDSADVPQIDIVINNAGIMWLPERRLSPEGIELQFATNHIGHYLFTNLIMPKIIALAKASPKGGTRIVNVSSRGVVYSPIRFSDWNHTKTFEELPESERPPIEVVTEFHGGKVGAYTPIVAYGQSKTANVLFSVQLNKSLYDAYGILSIALHPGHVMTELGRYIPPEEMALVAERARSSGIELKSPSEGASTQIVAALDPNLGPEDFFLAECRPGDWLPKWGSDPTSAEKLWKLSESLVGEEFQWP